jgi:hypothetical protein
VPADVSTGTDALQLNYEDFPAFKYHTIKAYGRSGCKTAHILDLGISWK